MKLNIRGESLTMYAAIKRYKSGDSMTRQVIRQCVYEQWLNQKDTYHLGNELIELFNEVDAERRHRVRVRS